MILDELTVAFLLKATQAHKDATKLTSPRATVRDGETAELLLSTKFNYISGYSEQNRPSDEPVPRHDSVELRNFITVKPQLTPDKKNIHIDFESEIRQLQGVEERMYKGKYPYQVPQISVVTTKTSCLVPDGKTLFMGQKITEEVERVSRVPMLGDLPLIGILFSNRGTIKEPRTLLILVKPIFGPQKIAQATRKPKPQPINPNDPLIKQLEEKFKRFDEQK